MILKLDGTNNLFLRNKELEDIFLPILRTEFKSIETYEINPKNNLVNSDFSVFYGVDDKTVDFEELSFWRKSNSKEMLNFRLNKMIFLINEYTEQVVKNQ
ncbi:hypothetical protein ABEX89_04600 [Bacillus velezensis]|uniref:hypothetical protein n=1 Tax=Bacillus amyloliquefaciens group TaxID=1938374 RepID=UPI000A17C836|nr:hypothetical protein [Bacillus velezensis]ARJ73674.1 hypothetical protein B7941_03715 [Bacillus velezensis]MEC3665590.1 hypothetical protein [Bacillus velezensis]